MTEEQRRLRNKALISRFKTLKKKAQNLIETKSSEAKNALIAFESFASKIWRKGFIPKRRACRNISTLTNRFTRVSS
jgi:ribosomal protein S20